MKIRGYFKEITKYLSLKEKKILKEAFALPAFIRGTGKFLAPILAYYTADAIVGRPVQSFWNSILKTPEDAKMREILSQLPPDQLERLTTTGSLNRGLSPYAKLGMGAGIAGMGALGYYLYKKKMEREFEKEKRRLESQKRNLVLNQKKYDENMLG